MMRLSKGFLLLMLLVGQSFVFAQPEQKLHIFSSVSDNETVFTCSKLKADWHKQSFKTHVAALAEEDYDVNHVQLYLILDNQSNDVNGHVKTTAQVEADSMTAYVFELSDLLQIDSLFINQQLIAPADITTSGDVITVKLPVTLMQSETFESHIYYHGTPENGDLLTVGSKAFNHLEDYYYPGNWATFSLSEPYDAKQWWPCKQSLNDKIDSVDVFVQIPQHLKAGSNGLLQSVTPINASEHVYHWKSTYPIDYYLISVAVGDYIDYSYKVLLPGATDSMPFVNYIYNDINVFSDYKAGIDSTVLMLEMLSQLFGTYPFYKEKYGHSLVPLFGGMEHQTMTTQGNFGTGLTMHELTHQWFGNYVTCGSWQDIWLNEGFASYGEYLFQEQFHGRLSADIQMIDIHERIMIDSNGSVYCTDTLNEGRIFSTRLTYRKGGAVLHTLRYLVNDDSLFFSGLRTYLSTFAFSTALTSDLQNVLQSTWQMNLSDYFDQWIYGEGHPIYDVEYNQIGSTFVLKVIGNNAKPNASNPYFTTPIDIQLKNAQWDTVIRMTFSQNGEALQAFTINHSVDSIKIDPANWVINKEGTIQQNLLLTVPDTNNTQMVVSVVPNPTADKWYIRMNGAFNYNVVNAIGQSMYSGDQHQPIIDAQHWAPGLYVLVIDNGQQTHLQKLLKR